MTYKKFNFLLFFISPLFAGAFILQIYLYDAFNFFHKAYFREQTFHNDARVQNKAYIDFNEFDSIILGTSMLENSPTSLANEQIGGKFLNISMSGSNIDERAIMLDYIYDVKKIKLKNVIYSLDSFSYLAEKIKEQEIKSPKSKYAFLYENDDFLPKFKFYLNKKFMRCAFTFSTKPKCVGDLKEREGFSIYRWFDNPKYANLQGLKNWKKDKFGKESLEAILNEKEKFFVNENINIEKEKQILQKYLLDYALKHKETNFHIIIPPYHKITYLINSNLHNYQSKDFILYARHKAAILWLLSQDIKNLKIYGFDDLAYTKDFNFYKDPTHYELSMNEKQIYAIADKKHILSKENASLYFENFENELKNYDLKALQDKINLILKQN